MGPLGLVPATSSWTPVFVSRPLNLSFLIWIGTAVLALPVSVIASCARLNTFGCAALFQLLLDSAKVDTRKRRW